MFDIQFKLDAFVCNLWNWIAFPYCRLFAFTTLLKNPKKSLQKWTSLIYIGLCYMYVCVQYSNFDKKLSWARGRNLRKDEPQILDFFSSKSKTGCQRCLECVISSSRDLKQKIYEPYRCLSLHVVENPSRLINRKLWGFQIFSSSKPKELE